MKRISTLLVLATAAALAIVSGATAGSQQSYSWSDCKVSVAVAKSSGGKLYGSATVVCDKRKAETEGSLALQAIGPGAFAVPAIPSGVFVNAFGFGGRTLINGYHDFVGCVDARADLTLRVSGLGTKTFTSGTSRICA